MANTISNHEQELLNFLEKSQSEVQKVLLEKESLIQYWESDEPDYQDDFGKITNHQREYYLSCTRAEYNTLNFRSMWLQSQITQIKSLNN